MSFTRVMLLGAFVSATLGIAVLVVVRLVTGRRTGGFDVLAAVAVSGAVALVQLLLVEEGFSKLHVAYLWLFVTLPVIGAAVLLGSVVASWRPRRWGAAVAGGLLALAAVGLYASYIEPRWLRTERVTLDVAALEGEPIRIGVLSDLQTDDIGSYERDAIDRLVAEEPDLILVAGDYFQSDGPAFEAALLELRALLGRLEAPGGVFLTEGDVDSPERMAVMTDGLDNLRWLDEEVVSTEVRGHTVHIGGISVRYRAAAAQATMDELARRTGRGDLCILLTHRPDAAFHVEEGGIDLVVAGHTHGGQVQVPFLGPPIKLSNVSRTVAAGGLHEIDGVPIYLSTGVGLERATAPQVRFLTRPSIGVVTLT